MSNRQYATRRSPRRPRASRPPPMLSVYRLAFRRLGPWFPGTLARLMERLWFQVHPRPIPAREERWLREADGSRLPFENSELALYRWGSGPSILLVHGWGGRAAQLGAFAQPLAERGFGVLAVDLPAHGRSPGRSTNILQIKDVLLSLDRSRGPFAGVITHSFGGMCLAVAVEAGLRVDRAVLICPPAGMDFLVERFAKIVRAPPVVVARFERRLAARFGFELHERIDTERVASRLGIPALVLHDADDRDVPLEQGERVARAWSGAEFVRTEGLGHARILRDPGVLRTVLDFLDQAESTRH